MEDRQTQHEGEEIVNEKQNLEARVQSITEELRSRRSTSAKQADVAIRADNRHDPDDGIVDESPDADEPEELSTSERQAKRSTGRARRGGWRPVRGA